MNYALNALPTLTHLPLALLLRGASLVVVSMCLWEPSKGLLYWVRSLGTGEQKS